MNDPNQKKITVTLPDGTIASKIVNAVVGDKPLGWSKHSYPPYYREKYALWLKRDIDLMIQTRKNLVFRYNNYKHTTPNSLYLRINQAMKYIIDKMDKDGKYAAFYSDVKVHREKGVGITITFDEVLEEEGQGGEFMDASKIASWRGELDKYLESEATGEPFHKGGLILNQLEIDQLKLELDGLSNIVFSISSSEIKVLKGV